VWHVRVLLNKLIKLLNNLGVLLIVLIFAILTINQVSMKQILTAKEEELMVLFWEHGQMCIRDLVNYIPEPKPHYNTVATLVKFLEEKGFLARKPVANTYLYSPIISEKRYRGETVSSVVRRYYDNSYASLVSQFVEEEKMNLDELKALIKQIENRKK